MKIKKIFMLALAFIVLTSCSYSLKSDKKLDIYYPVKNASRAQIAIKSEKHTVMGTEVQDIVKEIFTFSGEKPNSSLLLPALNGHIQLEKTDIKNENRIVLYLNSEYTNLSGIEKGMTDSCLTLSMCQIDGIQEIEIFAQGRPFSQVIKLSDIITGDIPITGFTQKMKIYFPDSEFTRINLETRDVELTGMEREGYAVISELMKGPKQANLSTVIPYGTKINFVYIEKDTCVVDLSAEFIKNHTVNERQERLCIEAIVKSLAQIKGVDKVQFLIDNDKVAGFTYYDLSKPFTCNQ